MNNEPKISKIDNLDKSRINLKKEMDKYKEKINDIKEKQMICAIDLLIEDFNIDEVVEIFEFNYQEFYEFINKRLKYINKDIYNSVIQKLKQDKYERTKHK